MRSADKPPNCCGFTMIELIMTMVMIGIMAVVAMPRLNITGTFDAMGYADQVKSLVQFAQKTAVAQRRMVYVDYATSPPTLCGYTQAASPSCASCATNITLPGGAFRSPQSSTTSSQSPSGSALCFDALGRPYGTSGLLTAQKSISISDSGSVANTIYIERETGYVHD